VISMRCGCGRKMKRAEVELRGFKLKGFRCACGEEAFDPRDVERVRQAVNEEVKARRVAHSLVVTVPRPLAKLAEIRAGDSLKWLFSENRLILEKN